MKNKEEKLFELVKDLFLKSYKPQLYLNEQTVRQYEADLGNAMRVADFIIETLQKKEE